MATGERILIVGWFGHVAELAVDLDDGGRALVALDVAHLTTLARQARASRSGVAKAGPVRVRPLPPRENL